ncbi:MAG TPA: PKD domain-containing protein [Acidimicrobiia bacterium]
MAGLGLSFNVAATPASADTQPVDPTLPETVTAAALPTVQINGVVWDQVIVGNRVYVTGQFTSARPAGAALGTDETPRSNILAYDLTTGNLIQSWAPTLNQQGLVITASADGNTIYVGGDFDKVNDQWIGRVAAINAQTGALVPGFNPGADTRVKSLALNGNTLYIGGYFSTLGGQARSHLGAVNATTGALLPWAPTTDREVVSMVVHPASGRVIIGGSFTTINGVTQRGMGSVDGVTGAVMPWAANQTIQDYGAGVEISSLVTDGNQIYGSGWTYLTGGGVGNLEGVFAADPYTGVINWIDAGRGDTYQLAVNNGVIYDVGHHHDWGMLGWNPQTLPDWEFQRTDAIDTRRSPTLTNAYGSDSLWNYFPGFPAAQPLHWEPTLTGGTYTGMGQAAWSVKTNGDYVVEGGEFPKVNGINQQGLVRFAKRAIAGSNVDPVQKYTELTPTLTGTSAGTVRVAWTAAWDRDNEKLKVEVLRGDTTATSTVLKTFNTFTNWWNRPPLAFYDTTAPAGSTQTYRIRVTDPFGNGFAGPPATVTVPAGTPAASTYQDSVQSDNPTSQWRLGETSGTLARDRAGSNDVTLGGSNQRNASGALLNQADPAVTFPGTNSTSTVQGTTSYWQPGPQTFSLEAWFKTNTSSGGKIIGFGNNNTGRSDTNNNDRLIYMTNAGNLRFGVRPDMGTRQTIASPSTYRDNAWHQVVGTLGADGMKLYVDGNLVASNANVTKAQVYRGYWRVGGDQLSSWPSAPSREAIAASIDEVAVYPTALTLGHVRAHYLASGRTTNFANILPSANFTATPVYKTVSFDATSSYDDDGTISSYLWNFGDNTSGSGATNQHTYANAGTYNVTLTVTDNRGGTNVITKQVTPTNPPPNIAPTASFTSVSTYHTGLFTSTSTDPDGTIASYAWDFGDSTTASGANPAHAYSAAGTYPVTLTVTDNGGLTNSTTSNVTVTDKYASDTFERSVASGLGSADVGGAWTLSTPAMVTSVANGAGQITGVVGANRAAYLSTPRQTDVDARADLTLDTPATGSGAYVSVIGRRVSNNNDYRLKVRYVAGGSVTAFLTRTVGGTETVLSSATVPGVTVAPGDVLRVRFQALGTNPTTLRGKVWRYGTQEPVSWLLNSSDSTAALAAPGDLGVLLFPSGSWTGTAPDLSIDNFSAGPDTGPPVNVPPTAVFTTDVQHLSASFDATGSSDADFGTIASYAWDFGDGTFGSGSTNQHTYSAEGTYTVTLTVTDNNGATNTVSHVLTVANIPPTSSFTASSEAHTASFTSTSTDPDGVIASSVWDFGDGSFGTGANPTHTYQSAGTYTVLLTVTDNNGASTTASNPVDVFDAAPNVPPVASFTSSVQLRTTTLTSTSTDSDGTIASSAWDFGDNTFGSGATNQHTYSAPGTYTVALTVTDNSGDTNTTSSDITIVNTGPTASFTSSSQNLTASFTSTSTDPDGTIASAAWDFGDTTGGTGLTTSHTYGAAGSYNVTLTVTDSDGATNTTVQPIVITSQYAADAFERTVVNGLGTADLGGPWTLSGAATSFAVNSGTGRITGVVNGNRSAYLTGVQQTDFDTKADLALDTAATGGGVYTSLINRRVSNGNDYRLKLRYTAGGGVTAFLTRTVGGTETVLSSTNVAGVTVVPGDVLKVRFQALGTSPTTLKAKVWRQGNAEPASWLLTTTDSTAALASPGDLGELVFTSSSWTGAVPTISLDNLVSGADAGAPGNIPPTASFTSSSSNHTATLTSTSSDTDGTITSSAWTFGDNTTGTGASVQHTYATAGTYTVTLTVTDNNGATSTTSQPVTVTNVAPTAGFTTSASFHTVTFTSTSSDTDGTLVSYLWTFDDGTFGSGATNTHLYANAGNYNAALTVTDNDGATNTVIVPITVSDPPPNIPPIASFTSSVAGHTASFTSTSSDPDGNIASTAWTFGDTNNGTGATTSHTYAGPGSYPVTITVTDNNGAVTSASGTIMITDTYASDLFERTVAGGLGTADVGGPWTISGTAANFSVSGGVGRILGTVNANRAGYVTGVHQTDQDTRADLSLDTAATGGGTYVSVISRRVSSGNDYRLKLRYTAGGGVTAYLTKTVGGVETILSNTNVTGLTVAPGDVLSVRFQVTGTSPTTLRAKVWRQGTAEPAAWLLTNTDSTAALAAAGDVGVLHYVSGSWTGAVPTMTIDNLSTTSPLAG